MQTAQQPGRSPFSERQPTIHSLFFPLIKLVGTFVVFYLFFKLQGGKAGADSLQIFTSGSFLENVAAKGGIIAIGAIGLSIALAAGMLDLSVAGITALSAGISATYFASKGEPVESTLYISAAIGTVAAGVTGLLNGILCGILRLPSAITTIATFVICCPIGAILASKGQTDFTGIRFDHLRVTIFIAIALGGIFQFIIRKTTFGIKLRACGANINTAREAGIPVGAYSFIALLICGILAGVCGGLFWLGDTAFASQPMGNMLTLGMQILAAALLGGASVKGGYSQPLATVIASMVIALFFAGVALIDTTPAVAQITAGFIVILTLLRNRMLGR